MVRLEIAASVLFLIGVLPIAYGDSDTPNSLTVSGRVVLPDGSPAVSAEVDFRLAYRKPLTGIVSDSDGRFEFDTEIRPADLIRHRLTVTARLPGSTPLCGDVRFPAVVGEQADAARATETIRRRLRQIEIRLEAAKVVVLNVVDGDGVPCRDAHAGVFVAGETVSRLTDATGRAEILLPQDAVVQQAFAKKSGVGFDYRIFLDQKSAHLGSVTEPPDLSEPINLQLTAGEPIRVRLTEVDGSPIKDATVRLWLLKKPSEIEHFNLSYLHELATEKTDVGGVATFDWIPEWRDRKVQSLTFWPTVSNDYVRTRGEYLFDSADGNLTLALPRLVKVQGQLIDQDGSPYTGEPMLVQADGADYSFDGHHGGALSDENGRFEVGLAPDHIYIIGAYNEKWATVPFDGLPVLSGQPVPELKLQLTPATRIHGRVVRKKNHELLKDQQVNLTLSGKRLDELDGVKLPNPGNVNYVVAPRLHWGVRTDGDGQFEFFVGPGEYTLRSGISATQTVKVNGEENVRFDIEVEPREYSLLKGRVLVGDQDEPAAKARVEVASIDFANRTEAKTDDQGRFAIQRTPAKLLIYAELADKNLYGVAAVGETESEVVIRLSPAASATGVLIETDTNSPAADRDLIYGIELRSDDGLMSHEFGASVKTDAEGRFLLNHLVVGQTYKIQHTIDNVYLRVTTVTPESSEQIDLGTLKLPEPYRPPTEKEYFTRRFSSQKKSLDRIKQAARDARLMNANAAIFIGDPNDESAFEFYNTIRKDDRLKEMRQDFRYTYLDVTQEEVATILGEWNIAQNDPMKPRLVIVNGLGEPVNEVVRPEYLDEGFAPVIAFFKRHRTQAKDASVLLGEAVSKAKAEDKRIFLHESATWCGPCLLLSRFYDKHKKIFDKHFVHVVIDDRWKGSGEVMDSLRETRRGIPWIAILDQDRQVLATSDGPDGNIGFPAGDDGVHHFLEMLRRSAPGMSEADLKTIEDDLSGEP
ncbi:thioredoxin family protein [Stratiformator vulcanicus]|uniref:Nickel uptake substrate-specific transmembrane region n=1 Tax=Stratiformator vulcanicus TaxID=2527980 RepID=A0A517R193_9PLAN|nr:thioredoxin family protein [Stratiformator vulcanicus]QDT37659.1 Nickel uptake substrate-specific transmembrane region [Stratiformator vulcanicus]